ncbi:MAG: ABC transporter substrate-binding protein [Thermomicrobiales bacterium]
MTNRRHRHTWWQSLSIFTITSLFVAGCSGASLGSDDADNASDSIKIGLLIPRSGAHQSLGEDAENGFQLYLDLNDGELGGRTVDVVIADEGDTAEAGKAAGERLLEQEQVDVIAGVMTSLAMHAIKDAVQQAEIPLIGTNSSPSTIDDYTYIWRTSFLNDDAGVALGEFVASEHQGESVYLIAADYAAGREYTEGFKRTFLPAGGTVAGEAYTPFPTTTNFQPYLTNILQSGAKAVYCFYAAGAAVDFVKQFEQFGLREAGIKLYAPGYLTEGAELLAAQGNAAEGIWTSQNYSPDLDNAANRTFVAEYQERHGAQPTTYAMAAYDAAMVLDLAIAAAGDDIASRAINEAMASIGQVDSPRGPWEFNERRTPAQMWYLRQVQGQDGSGTLANVIIKELDTLG